MAKQGDLWDDSALINAFDDAISKYKIMHGRKANDVSKEKGEVVSSSGDDPLGGVDEQQETTRQKDAHEKSNLQPDTATEVGESSNPSVVTHCIDPVVPESYAEVAEGVQGSHSYAQGAQDYNQLLQQYYEIEEKRQQVIQQLNQYGSWNYQCSQEGSGSGMQWANGPTLHEHQLTVCQASNPAASCPCCPYVTQCFATPCTSVPTCFVGGSCAGKSCTDACEAMVPRISFPQQDSKLVETAMGAAERAISSMKIKISDDSIPNEADREKEKDGKEGAVVQSTSLETDLTEVLNAWYSAGFYTGKYLVEQSMAKKGQR